jgi:Na+/H+ antiporter NhaA
LSYLERYLMLLPVRRWLIAKGRDPRFGGIALSLAGVAAISWANVSPAGSYIRTWTHVAPWSSPLDLRLTYRAWVNQALLFPFFTLVGLEIRREITAGELRTVRRAGIPVIAALVGMAVPALIYTACVAGGAGSKGWGVPMATDVAFALGALAFVGPKAPRLRIFLMTLAVADDVASILVLVVFYSVHIRVGWLAAGLVALVALVAVWAGAPLARPIAARAATTSRVAVRAYLPDASRAEGSVRIVLVAVVWWSFLHAGVEAAVIGILLGIFGPRRATGNKSLSPRVRAWVRGLEPIVDVVILPVFALANVGIRLFGADLTSGAAGRVFLAVVVARVIGKPVGITLGAVIGRKVTRTQRSGAPLKNLVGVGALASIGFTVPLLIIPVALPAGSLTTAATAGLLVGSVLGVALGATIFRLGPVHHLDPEPTDPDVARAA